MTSFVEQINQLKEAIAAQESLRGRLPDEIIDAAIETLREKLAALEATAQPEQQRKLATILFMDMAGHTGLFQGLDPEENLAIVDGALARLAESVAQYGGNIVRFQGDGFKAAFGLPSAHEDDPESAIRAALSIQATAQTIARELEETRGVVGFKVRVGIDTGLIIAGGLTEREDAVSGMTVNLAARLESAAEPGSILISHNTYRHVRGVFDVRPRDPMQVKGFDEPVRTYVVLQAKPRAFRMATRGIEGVETRMIGRDHELGMLQEAYIDASEAAETRLITIVGEAGVGKSRLLYEFGNWLELRPELIAFHKGRATPAMQHTRFGLFRDLFALRFDILESDTFEATLAKFRRGMAPTLDPDRADVVGRWLGFDFANSPAVARLAGNPEFAAAAKAHLIRYLRELARSQPVVAFLEDIHWADDGSLDLIPELVTSLPNSRLLIVCCARPSLFERRTHWTEGLQASGRLELKPLSRRLTGALVDEVLQRVQSTPDALCELIIENAEGNPFYVEELVKMLIDEGVIIPEDSGWQVDADRLTDLHVPATLTGILQARLDSLPRQERETVQRAAVVGRLFWDAAVAELSGSNVETIRPALEAARERELLLRRERSSFISTTEYAFRHHLMREVAYETVLLRARRQYHAQVAHWLETNAGERLSEFLGLIAHHYRLAGENSRAADFFQRAGNQALAVGAYRPARASFEEALALYSTASEEGRAIVEVYNRLGQACWHLGDFQASNEALTRGLQAATHTGDEQAQVFALYYLAQTAGSLGDFAKSQAFLQKALPLAQALGGESLARTLFGLGGNAWRTGDIDTAEAYTRESLALAQANGYAAIEVLAVNMLGLIAGVRADLDTEKTHYEMCLELSRRIGDLYREAISLANLGVIAILREEYREALHCLENGLEIFRDLGSQESIALNLGNLALVQMKLDDMDAARRSASEALRLAVQLGALPRVLNALLTWAELSIAEGNSDKALALLGLARNHAATEYQAQQEIERIAHSIGLDAAETEAGLAAGATLDLDTVVAEVLAGAES